MREDPQWRGKGVSTTAMTGQAPAKRGSTEYFFLWRPCLPDSSDALVLEVAVAGGCDAIITLKINVILKILKNSG
jgi:hypothetical protein